MDYKKGELVHNLVMEKIIRRKLESYEVVHHIDLKKQNNNPENLYLSKTRSLHQKLHGQFGRLAKVIAKELLNLGYIRFDKEIGEYYCIFDDGITNKFTKKWRDFEFIEKLAKEKEYQAKIKGSE